MSEVNKIRLNKVIREFNISLERVVEFLSSNGHEIEPRPTTKISQAQYDLLLAEFSSDRSSRVESHDLIEEKQKRIKSLRKDMEKAAKELNFIEYFPMDHSEIYLDISNFNILPSGLKFKLAYTSCLVLFVLLLYVKGCS